MFNPWNDLHFWSSSLSRRWHEGNVCASDPLQSTGKLPDSRTSVGRRSAMGAGHKLVTGVTN